MYVLALKTKHFISLTFVLLFCLSANAQTDQRLTEREVQIQGSFIEAEKFRLIGFCEKAIPLYQQVLSAKPRETAAMYGIARCYEEEGEIENALRWYRQAIQHASSNPWYRRQLIRVLDAQGSYVEAAQQAEQLLEMQAENPDYYYLAAYYQARSGSYDQAIKTLNRLQKRIGFQYEILERKYLLLIDQQAFKKAEKLVKDYLAERPQDVQALFLLADLYRKNYNWNKASGVYEEILRLSPNNALAVAGLAEMEAQTKDNGHESSTVAVDLHQLFARTDLSCDDKIKAFIPFVQQAVQTADEALLKEGIDLAELLLQEYPQQASAHAVMADLLYGANQLKSAADAYARSLELNPAIHSVWTNYLDVLWALGDLQKLSAEAEKAIDFFPNEWYFYYLAGRAYLGLKESEEAANWLQEALPLCGKNKNKRAATLSQLAIAYEQKNQRDKSDEMLKALQLLGGESPLWLSTKAYISGLRGENLDRALQWAEQAVEKEPHNPDFQRVLRFLKNL